jgi:hypothetical protein
MLMACLECGLEQAVADAETFTGPGGQELWVDGSGIHLRGTRNAPARLISWDEIGWLRDGWVSRAGCCTSCWPAAGWRK